MMSPFQRCWIQALPLDMFVIVSTEKPRRSGFRPTSQSLVASSSDSTTVFMS